MEVGERGWADTGPYSLPLPLTTQHCYIIPYYKSLYVHMYLFFFLFKKHVLT